MQFKLCRQLGEKLDIALVMSVGSGIYPAEELGKTDAQEFLYFGKHWLKAGHAIKARAKSLITLLTTAVSAHAFCLRSLAVMSFMCVYSWWNRSLFHEVLASACKNKEYLFIASIPTWMKL